MFPKNLRKKACESHNGSNTSLKNINPPWCSGKLTERRKLSPNWEIQSSYPLRENIWEYLHKSENLKWRSLNRKTNKPEKCRGSRIKLILLIFLSMICVIGCFWKLYPTQSSKVLNKIILKTKSLTVNLLKFIDWKNSSASEECCHDMRNLALELSRKERILRNTLRINTMMSKWREKPYVQDTFIEELTAAGGSSTEELNSRSVSLWGFGPLWQQAPSPNLVLSVKDPHQADCWAFRGSEGSLHIYLPYAQQVNSISVEHVTPDTANSAPKLFELFGILYDDSKMRLVKGEYHKDGPAKQYFRVHCDDAIKEVIFNVISNHGNEKYTCIYRIHLYGNEHNRY